MDVAWTEEASAAFDALRMKPGHEAAFDAVSERVRLFEENPGARRVGAEQRRVEGVWLWWTVLGPDHARWLLTWAEPEPGLLVIESLDPLGSS